ncbi:MAG: LruC domain-containing protein [Shewanella sp.]|nr:LruC domain-containing protein [Shewanella sp.]
MLNHVVFVQYLRCMLLISVLSTSYSASSLTLNISGVPSTEELEKYLIVGTGSSSDGDAVNIQGTEIGADQVFLSDGSLEPNTAGEAGPNTADTFYQDGLRWFSNSSVPTDAGNVYVGINWSGNIALTDNNGEVSFSNTDFYAEIGIDCSANGVAHCRNGLSGSRYFALNVSGTNGASINSAINPNTDLSTLESEMSSWDTFITGLTTDLEITANIENQNRKDGSGPYLTTFSDSDGNGIMVIDINVGNNDFEINNSDWILQGSENQLYVIRVLNGSNVNISNSSLLVGDGGIAGTDAGYATEVGVIFYHDSDGSSSSDTIYNFDNAVINGIAFWDRNNASSTTINVSNAQGCAQFIGAHINMSNVRFSHCPLSYTESSPSSSPSPSLSRSYYPAQNQFGTLMFEDNFPKKGDYDFNDFVVRYQVTVTSNAETQAIKGISWISSLVAAGADYSNAYGSELPINWSFNGTSLSPAVTLADTASFATLCIADASTQLEIGTCSDSICPIDDTCDGSTANSSCSLDCSSGQCITQSSCTNIPSSVSAPGILKLFYLEKEFTDRTAFFNTQSVNSEENWSETAPFKWQVSLTFPDDGATIMSSETYCSSKGKSSCTYSTLPPYNPFISIHGDQSKEVHLPNHLGTALYDAGSFDENGNHAGSSCGISGSENGSCYQTSTGLPWALNMTDSSFYAWPKERHEIINVFTGDSEHLSFSDWVESGGNSCSGQSCSWWMAAESEQEIKGSSLGEGFKLKTKQEALICESTNNGFFIRSNETDYDVSGLETNDQGLEDSLTADWSNILEIDAQAFEELCSLLGNDNTSFWTRRNTSQLYTPTHPYYTSNNKTDDSTQIHAYRLLLDTGELTQGSTSTTWSDLSTSLGGCTDNNGNCSFEGVTCYIILGSSGGNKKTLGKWKEH